VIAARLKHFTETIERDPDLFAADTEIASEVSAAV
jgi:hypothetical protein